MGIFAERANGLWTLIDTNIKFRGKVYGGLPMDAKGIAGWIENVLGLTNKEQIAREFAKRLRELAVPEELLLGAEESGDPVAELQKLASEYAAEQRVGFRRNEAGELCLHQTQVKALFKEAGNALHASKTRFGPSRKGAKNFFAEHIWVEPALLSFGVTKPDGVDTKYQRVQTPQGPRSTIKEYEFMEGRSVPFTYRFTRLGAAELLDKKGEPKEVFAELLNYMEQLALGAARATGVGEFDFTDWQVRENGASLGGQHVKD